MVLIEELPDIPVRPVIDREHGVLVRHCPSRSQHRCDIGQSLNRFCGPYTRYCDAGRTDTRQEILICINPRIQFRMCPYCEWGRLSHPHIFLRAVPTDERLIVGQGIEAVEVLDFHAKPFKRRAHHEELLPPVANRLFYTRKYRLLINELDC